MPANGPTSAVILVLPGGKQSSFAPARDGQLTARRMRPFSRALHRAGAARGVTVAQLRYRYRGWNDPDASPVADGRWALAWVRESYGKVPVVLVGHSMGGRTALRIAGEASVRGVVALAPWTPEHEPVAQLAGRALLIAHGSLDMITSPALSSAYAQRAASFADPVARVVVRGDSHAMLTRWGLWHRLATDFAMSVLGAGRLAELSSTAELNRAVQLGRAGDFAVTL